MWRCSAVAGRHVPPSLPRQRRRRDGPADSLWPVQSPASAALVAPGGLLAPIWSGPLRPPREQRRSTDADFRVTFVSVWPGAAGVRRSTPTQVITRPWDDPRIRIG